MTRVRVLIVDDSVVVRRILRQVIGEDPDLEVAGTAANGRIALSLIDQASPDVVTLDVEMPEMDGLQALQAIRASRPKLPVIMFSTVTQRGAVATLDALAAGASDYVTKPENVAGLNAAVDRIRRELVPKIKALCCHRTASGAVPSPNLPRRLSTQLPARPKPRPGPIEVVAIGTSTGGPNALTQLLPRIPADFPVPILIVQHMPPTFTRFLAERLSAFSSIPVREGIAGEVLRAGEAWIAPGDFHMTVERMGARVRLSTNTDPPENSCRPSVDVLFRSVAEVYASRALAVVMTGMGQDGFRGSEVIRDAGGRIFAQDEASSVVWGMPGFVVQAGLAERVLPLEQIGSEIVRKVMQTQVLIHS